MKITAVEYEKTQIQLSDDEHAFLTEPRFDGRFRVRRLQGTLGYEFLAENVVGALRLPSGRQLFIPPKLPLPNLFQMLSYVGDLKVPLDADVAYEKDEGLFNVIGRIFVGELSRIFRNGLKQLYRQQEAPLRSLRGRILFGESIKKALVGSERLYCRYSNLSLDIPINRALVTAAQVLLRSSAIAPTTKKQIWSCLSHLPTGSIEPSFQLSDFKNIHLDRGTQYYERILFLSRFILASCSYTHMSGNHAFSGMLLDVSKLFEDYVTKALHEYADQSALRVLSQKEVKLDREREVTCRPDLTFISADRTEFIADTKYKNFSDLKFRNEDVFQVIAYLLHHRCRQGFLIYPSFNGKDAGVLKSIHVPTEVGDITVHGLCVTLDTPESVATQVQNALTRAAA